jgi:peptide/nickel transport system permease protein
VTSLLDGMLADLVASREKTYSVPLSFESFTKESQDMQGRLERIAPRLAFGGAHLKDPSREWAADVALRAAAGAIVGVAAAAVLAALLVTVVARRSGRAWRETARDIVRGHTPVPWRAAIATLFLQGLFIGTVVALMSRYHVFGTDVTGNDVLYQTLKSIRTAFVIGALSTLFTLPLAVVLGIVGGYLRGWVDEAIQYLYTVLSSIPRSSLRSSPVLGGATPSHR